MGNSETKNIPDDGKINVVRVGTFFEINVPKNPWDKACALALLGGVIVALGKLIKLSEGAKMETGSIIVTVYSSNYLKTIYKELAQSKILKHVCDEFKMNPYHIQYGKSNTVFLSIDNILRDYESVLINSNLNLKDEFDKYFFNNIDDRKTLVDEWIYKLTCSNTNNLSKLKLMGIMEMFIQKFKEYNKYIHPFDGFYIKIDDVDAEIIHGILSNEFGGKVSLMKCARPQYLNEYTPKIDELFDKLCVSQIRDISSLDALLINRNSPGKLDEIDFKELP